MRGRFDRRVWHALGTIAVAAGIVIGCGGGDEIADDAVRADESTTSSSTAPPDPVAVDLPPTDTPELLSGWQQVVVSGGELVLQEGVVPYSLNSALFSDYAHKLRTVWLPDGSEPAGYQADDVFDFPVGTVITKTFYYPVTDAGGAYSGRVMKVAQSPDILAAPLDLAEVRLLETRVLVHRDGGWKAFPYVWNDDQTEAVLARTGDLLSLTLLDGETETPFPYVVPNVNQCSGCHATNHTTKAIQPIGPKARHLNLEVDGSDGRLPQLELWQARGLLGEIPDLAEVARAAIWDDDSAALDSRARAYLDVNCAHCHNRVGPADTSGLFLESSTELGPGLGVCKLPVAAGTGTGGRLVGIHPGEPDQSIFVYRMETSDPGAMMPELGRSLTHAEGVELISTWIESLPGDC